MGLKVETPDGPGHQPEMLVYSSKWPILKMVVGGVTSIGDYCGVGLLDVN